MPKIKNISPRGDLDVPLLRRIVAAGETVDVTVEQAGRLLAQAANFAPADDAAAKLAPPGKPATAPAAKARRTRAASKRTGKNAGAGKPAAPTAGDAGSTDHSEVSS